MLRQRLSWPGGRRLGAARHAALAAALLLAGAAAPLLVAAQDATPAADATPLATDDPTYGGLPSTAILAMATNEPRVIVGSDGLRHYEYDLIVLNTFLAPVTLTNIDVVAPDGTQLATMSGDNLVNATQPILGATPQTEIAASAAVAIDMDVALPADVVVDSLTHQITYSVPSDARDQALVATHTTAGPTVPVSAMAAIVIAPPLAGEGWVALNGCCAAGSVHRFERVAVDGVSIAKAEMFAIDWVQIRDGVFNSGEGDAVEDYYAYGAEVRSATAGTVVFVKDDMPDQAPGAEVGITSPESFGGNQVMVEIEPDRYAWYAHLKPGSVQVAVGDVVTVGQPLGQLGNSGNTTAPHLHFGLLDAPNSVTGTGVPVALTEYELVGTIDPAILFAPEPPPGGKLPVDTTTAGPQTETWPLYLTVINLPE